MRRLLLPLASVLLLWSCSKTQNVNNAPADLVVGGYMSTKLNGINWIADSGYAALPYSDYLQVFGQHDPATNRLTDITINIDGYHGPDSYVISDTGATTGLYFYDVTPYNAESGVITVVTDDSVHVRGSFSFTGTTSQGVKVDVTNGQFNLKKR